MAEFVKTARELKRNSLSHLRGLKTGSILILLFAKSLRFFVLRFHHLLHLKSSAVKLIADQHRSKFKFNRVKCTFVRFAIADLLAF